jgi:hypothetical protein
VVALAPTTVAVELPEGVVALQIEDDARLETALVWRADVSRPQARRSATPRAPASERRVIRSRAPR